MLAAACKSLDWISVFGLAGLTSAAIGVDVGTNATINSNPLAISSVERQVTPVMLPPGRFKLATRPNSTGSPPIENTIGIDMVAALPASAAGVATGATIALT